MSRRQRQGKGGYDHGAHDQHPGRDLWGKRPMSKLPHSSYNKKRCRRKERRRRKRETRRRLLERKEAMSKLTAEVVRARMRNASSVMNDKVLNMMLKQRETGEPVPATVGFVLDVEHAEAFTSGQLPERERVGEPLTRLRVPDQQTGAEFNGFPVLVKWETEPGQQVFFGDFEAMLAR